MKAGQRGRNDRIVDRGAGLPVGLDAVVRDDAGKAEQAQERHEASWRGECRAGVGDAIGGPSLDPRFAWLQSPVLNGWTRLVFVAEAASGAFVAQGIEAGKPATMALQATA